MSLPPSQAHFHHFKRLSATNAITEAYTIHCFSMDTTQDDTLQLPDTIPHDLASVLHGFASVFAVPTGLPPSRTHDHSIVLQDGVNVVKVRPYRYPVSQKAQIEAMVADMLAQVTIKDSFLMPTVDELLDELHGSTWQLHLEHLTMVLGCLQDHRLYAKLSKCAFGQERIEYLGHVVTGAGVEMDPAKVTAVANWPKNNFKWSQEAESAFEILKQALQTTHVLVLPDFSKPFIVETDASGKGIGAILSQA
ncbi:ty3-gypsy retrotransposon protein, partial [Tanacetum coccineum]